LLKRTILYHFVRFCSGCGGRHAATMCWAGLQRASCRDSQIVQTLGLFGGFVGLFRTQDPLMLGLDPIKELGLPKHTDLSGNGSLDAAKGSNQRGMWGRRHRRSKIGETKNELRADVLPVFCLAKSAPNQ